MHAQYTPIILPTCIDILPAFLLTRLSVMYLHLQTRIIAKVPLKSDGEEVIIQITTMVGNYHSHGPSQAYTCKKTLTNHAYW